MLCLLCAKIATDFIVSLIDRGADAQDIVDRALAIPTGDNVTAILITL